MNKEEKFKKDEKGAAVVVWSVMAILIIVIVGLIIWANGSGNSVSATPTVASDGATSTDATTTTQSANAINNIKNNEHMVTIQTNKGTIVFETYDADAPNTVN